MTAPAPAGPAARARPIHGMVLLLGTRGAGKTSLLQAIERRARLAGGRTVIQDLMGHWRDLPAGWSVNADDPHGELVATPGSGPRLAVKTPSAEEAARVAIANAPCTLFVDEAALAFPCENPPRVGTDGSVPALLEIALMGRQAKGVGEWRRPGPVALVMATQRPAMIATMVRSLLDRLFVMRFPTMAVTDLEWIEKATRSKAIAERATQLAEGEWIVVEGQHAG